MPCEVSGELEETFRAASTLKNCPLQRAVQPPLRFHDPQLNELATDPLSLADYDTFILHSKKATDELPAAGISRVKGVKQLGFRSGNWLTVEQCSEVLKHASGRSLRAKRDYAMLAMLLGCGLRRSELVGLQLDEVQMRQGHWTVVDLIGKGGHIRTVPIPAWVKGALDEWATQAGITQGRIFRAVSRMGKVWGHGVSQNVVWYVVKTCNATCQGIAGLYVDINLLAKINRRGEKLC